MVSLFKLSLVFRLSAEGKGNMERGRDLVLAVVVTEIVTVGAEVVLEAMVSLSADEGSEESSSLTGAFDVADSTRDNISRASLIAGCSLNSNSNSSFRTLSCAAFCKSSQLHPLFVADELVELQVINAI